MEERAIQEEQHEKENILVVFGITNQAKGPRNIVENILKAMKLDTNNKIIFGV